MVDIIQKSREIAFKSQKMYVSVPVNKVQVIEDQLNKIFKDELNAEGSILVSYKPEIISKLAKFLSGHVTRYA